MTGPSKHIKPSEFFAAMFGIFSFIFAVHMSADISFRWFRFYVAVLIVLVQLISLACFIRYFKKGQ